MVLPISGCSVKIFTMSWGEVATTRHTVMVGCRSSSFSCRKSAWFNSGALASAKLDNISVYLRNLQRSRNMHSQLVSRHNRHYRVMRDMLYRVEINSDGRRLLSGAASFSLTQMRRHGEGPMMHDATPIMEQKRIKRRADEASACCRAIRFDAKLMCYFNIDVGNEPYFAIHLN